MEKIIKGIFIIMLFSMIFGSDLSARVIHLLAVGDTDDPRIGRAHVGDLKNIRDIYSYLAQQCAVPISMKELSGNTFTFGDFQTWLHEESVSHDDVIIFHYTGHGGRTYKSPTMWPFACFLQNERVEFTKMIEGVLSKKAALSIVVISACNSWVTQATRAEGKLKLLPDLEKLDGQQIATGCKKLLFERYGLIICSGAIPGGVSFVQPSYEDGYLTSCFLANFIAEAQTKKPSWERIFKITKSECHRFPPKRWRNTWGEQIPQHKLFLFTCPKSKRAYKWYLYKRCSPEIMTFLGSK